MNNELETSSAKPNNTKSRLKKILALAGGLFVYSVNAHLLENKADSTEQNRANITIPQTRASISTAMAEERPNVLSSDKNGILIIDRNNK